MAYKKPSQPITAAMQWPWKGGVKWSRHKENVFVELSQQDDPRGIDSSPHFASPIARKAPQIIGRQSGFQAITKTPIACDPHQCNEPTTSTSSSSNSDYSSEHDFEIIYEEAEEPEESSSLSPQNEDIEPMSALRIKPETHNAKSFKRKRWRWCRICSMIVPNKAFHCTDCNVCIDEYDHHCPWTSKCIGSGNKILFYSWLGSAIIAIGYVAILAAALAPT